MPYMAASLLPARKTLGPGQCFLSVLRSLIRALAFFIHEELKISKMKHGEDLQRKVNVRNVEASTQINDKVEFESLLTQLSEATEPQERVHALKKMRSHLMGGKVCLYAWRELFNVSYKL